MNKPAADASKDRLGRPGESATASDTATFLRDAAGAGQMEVELGRIAARQGQNERVRQFGQRMVDDHSRANQELMSVARRTNMELPSELQPEHRKHVEHLSGLQGENFDRDYMKMMVRDHQDVVRKFEEQSRSATDPDVRGFAERTLPVLREHLRMARDIAREIGVQGIESGANGTGTRGNSTPGSGG